MTDSHGRQAKGWSQDGGYPSEPLKPGVTPWSLRILTARAEVGAGQRKKAAKIAAFGFLKILMLLYVVLVYPKNLGNRPCSCLRAYVRPFLVPDQSGV